MVTQSIPVLRNQKYCTLASAHVSQQGKESIAGNFQDPDQCKKWQGLYVSKSIMNLTS